MCEKVRACGRLADQVLVNYVPCPTIFPIERRSRGDIRTDAAQEVPTWAEMAYRGNSRNHEFDGRSTDKDADQQNRGRRNDHVRVLG